MKSRPVVTKDDIPQMLENALKQDTETRQRVVQMIQLLREGKPFPKGSGIGNTIYGVNDHLAFGAICQAVWFDDGAGENTKSIRDGYGLTDEDINFIIRITREYEKEQQEEDTSDSSSTPLLPFTNPDGTPQDLDALDALEKLEAENTLRKRNDNHLFGIAKVLQMSRRVMIIPFGEKKVTQEFNVARSRAKDQVIVSVTWELAKELAKDFQLTFFDMRVENACYNLWDEGRDKATIEMIVRELDFMTGDQDASEERIKKVLESLQRLSMLSVEVDYTAQMQQIGAAKDGEKYYVKGYAIDLKWFRVEKNGKSRYAVKIKEAPIFTNYSNKVHQAVTVPREIMMAATIKQFDKNGNYIEGTGTLSNTQIVGDYRYYMAHQLKRIANTGNHKIKYDSIFDEIGDTVPMEKNTNGRKTRSKRKEVIAKLLDAWQAVGFIRSWKTTKTKGVEDGVEITMSNPAKGLKEPEKR